MTWGRSVETLLRSYESTGKVPPALESQPDLGDPVLAGYLNDFFTLNKFRQPGAMGAAPLAFSDVVLYAILTGNSSSEEILHFSRLMGECDRVYLTKMEERREQEKKAEEARQKAKSKSRPARRR